MRYLNFIIVLLSISCLQASPEFEAGIAQAHVLETSQGHLLRYTHFESPVRCEKKHVVFIQGRGTFLEFYEVLVDPLLERGYDVWTYDLTGQGGSSRLPLSSQETSSLTKQRMQHVANFDSYLVDMHEFIQTVVLPQVGDHTLLLGGYSKGGHVALRYLQTHPQHPFKGVFAISPLLSLKLPLSHTLVLQSLNTMGLFTDLDSYVKGACDVDPIFAMTFETNPYTSDPQRFQEMVDLCVKYPDWMMGGVSMSWLRAAIDSVFALWEPAAIQAIQIPVLLSTGESDGVVDVSYNAQFVKELPKAKHLLYPKGRHELFREAADMRADWWHEFDLFFLNQL